MFFVIGISIAFFLDLVLISKKRKTAADKILAAWLFVMGIHLFLYYIDFTGLSFKYTFLLGSEIPIPLLHGPFLFLYTSTLTNQAPSQKKYWILHFIPAIASWIYMIGYYSLPGEQKVFIFKHEGIGYESFMLLNFTAIVVSGIIYIGWSSFLLRKHKIIIREQFSYTEKINLKWLQYLIYGLATVWIAVFLGTDELIFTVVVVFIFFIGYFGVKQVGIFSNNDPLVQTVPVAIKNINEEPGDPLATETALQQQEEMPQQIFIEQPTAIIADKRKYFKSGLTERTAETLHQELIKLMESEQLYLESELTLADLAKRLNTHPNYLSQVINEKEGKNLYDYINTLRIEAFKQLLSDPKNQQFTILSLAYECGFNSKSSFNRYFKKATGESPSAYMRNLQLEVKAA